MPSVMMNGSHFWWTTRKPLTKPTTAPAASATTNASQMGSPALITMIARMPPRHSVPPTDKSQPPQMTATVTPKATISRIAAERSISSIL